MGSLCSQTMIARLALDHGARGARIRLGGMTAGELNNTFGLPGVLRFEQEGELVRAQITTAVATATVYLYGAHLTEWQPAGEQPVIFLSNRTELTPGKAIRGGIPICLPWFAMRGGGGPGPSHGFARIEPWTLAFAALAGEDLHLTLTLAPTELSKSLGFDDFRFAYEISIGRTLTLRLTVANMGEQPMRFEEALHTYFHVGDVRKLAVEGLEAAAYFDKTDGLRQKLAPAEPLRFTATTDSVFAGARGEVKIVDAVLQRTIRVEKVNSATTVVWNPFAQGAAKIADLGPEEWPDFVCVEAANTGADAIMLAAGQAHTMQMRVSLDAGGDGSASAGGQA